MHRSVLVRAISAKGGEPGGGGVMRISVIGAGYVGIVLGTCMADSGLRVALVDIDEDKMKLLQQGKLPMYEPGVEQLFVENWRKGRIECTNSYAQGLDTARAAFVAVGTPPLEDGSADLSRIKAAAAEIAQYAPANLVLVIKSTVPVGTAASVRQLLTEAGRKDIEVVSNPEFLREGRALGDFQHPDRIVIGARSAKAAHFVARLCQVCLRSESPVLMMDNASAEMTKYASNAFLATRISFANEIANICDRVGANVDDVLQAMGADHRIGNHYLHPGCGYGGSCFPKDVQALINMANGNKYAAGLLHSVHQTNEHQKQLLGHKILRYFHGDLKGRVIGVWGLSFKENTDDIRQSPSLTLINYLIGKHAQVRVFDPASVHCVADIFPDHVVGCPNKYEAVRGVDALAVVTPWQEFKNPDWERVKSLLRQPVVFDGRNLYDPAHLAAMGFTYVGFGRPNGQPTFLAPTVPDRVEAEFVPQ